MLYSVVGDAAVEGDDRDARVRSLFATGPTASTWVR
jgi:hypothetical protein